MHHLSDCLRLVTRCLSAKVPELAEIVVEGMLPCDLSIKSAQICGLNYADAFVCLLWFCQILVVVVVVVVVVVGCGSHDLSLHTGSLGVSPVGMGGRVRARIGSERTSAGADAGVCKGYYKRSIRVL